MKSIIFIISFLFILALQGVLSTEAKVAETTTVATNEGTEYHRRHHCGHHRGHHRGHHCGHHRRHHCSPRRYHC